MASMLFPRPLSLDPFHDLTGDSQGNPRALPARMIIAKCNNAGFVGEEPPDSVIGQIPHGSDFGDRKRFLVAVIDESGSGIRCDRLFLFRNELRQLCNIIFTEIEGLYFRSFIK
jgi:hypothetical protein